MRFNMIMMIVALISCASVGSQRTRIPSAPVRSSSEEGCVCVCNGAPSADVAEFGILSQLELLLIPELAVDVDTIMQTKQQWLGERQVSVHLPIPQLLPVVVHAPHIHTSRMTPSAHVKSIEPPQVMPLFHFPLPWWKRAPTVPLLPAPPSRYPDPSVLAAWCNVETRFDLSKFPIRHCKAIKIDWRISESYMTCPNLEEALPTLEFPTCTLDEEGISTILIVFVGSLVVSIMFFSSTLYACVLADPIDYQLGPRLIELCRKLGAPLLVAALVCAFENWWPLAWLYFWDDVLLCGSSVYVYVRGLRYQVSKLQAREEERELKRVTRNNAASRISASFKAYQAKKSFKALAHAAGVLQRRFRLIRARRRADAAVTIQRSVRRWLLSRREVETVRRTEAAVKVQAMMRGVLVRRHRDRQVRAATVIQANFRAHLARRAIHATATLAKISGVSPGIILSAPSFAESSPIMEFKESSAAFSKMLSSRRLSICAKRKHDLAVAFGIDASHHAGHSSSMSSHSASSSDSMKDRRPLPLPMHRSKRHTIRG